MTFEPEIHGYRTKDLQTAWEKIRFELGQTGQKIEVLVPTQYNAVGAATFIFDWDRWVLKSVR
jgi:hypothetical protein